MNRGLINRFHSLFAIGLIATLWACSGMTGGGGPGGVGAGGALDGGSVGGGGGGSSGDLGSGQGVPSTQASEGSIGGGCAAIFKVTVRVIEGGFVRLCDGRQGPKAEFADIVAANTGTMAKALARDPLDPLPTEVLDDSVGTTPKVYFTLIYNGTTSPSTKDAECKADGSWEAEFFHRIVCVPISATTSAQMKVGDQIYSSQTFNGPPFAEHADNVIPILLTISH